MAIKKYTVTDKDGKILKIIESDVSPDLRGLGIEGTDYEVEIEDITSEITTRRSQEAARNSSDQSRVDAVESARSALLALDFSKQDEVIANILRVLLNKE